ncbi:hypothetical protein PTSG_09375 [Salpingoeca rosetta]|uniref:Palmitoyltransferase n=1 Tax=Salpingoeca rosetta (strain ATCC 50818 / BSB-021) TaxID=946362 RepID=F2UMF9_SALR5|nr:uncharacterized protein PTSG_09375 [Salpingoeca rosetta]EGD78308.1 hypothetical protein PTSG_09375 [Salpingoeca rosetta]|eukprot:XP_004989631.1 hypothetical protein PTSG_09375 [Salpingoeca rosetta]
MEPLPVEDLKALDAFMAAEVEHNCRPCCSSRTRHGMVTCVRFLVHTFIWVADNLMYMLGWVFVPLAWVLIGSIVIAWYKVLAPYIQQETSSLGFAAHVVFTHWLLINIIFNYLMVTITSPGYPPKMRLNDIMLQPGESFCKKCDSVKPVRTHHCSVCKRCVLKMDHHCPWVHNCIGFRNHRYFFLFMAYLWVGCVYVGAVCAPLFLLRYRWRFHYDTLTNADKIEIRRLLLAGYLGPVVTFAFVLTVAVGIALGLLLFWHVYLVSRGETTIEYYATFKPDQAKKDRPVYSAPQQRHTIGQRWRLFLGIDGGRSIWGVLLPSTFRPSGDGMTWTVASSDGGTGTLASSSSSSSSSSGGGAPTGDRSSTSSSLSAPPLARSHQWV